MKNYGWGSDNLRREITYASVGQNKAVIEFANGSWIKVVTASDSGRGNQVLVYFKYKYKIAVYGRDSANHKGLVGKIGEA